MNKQILVSLASLAIASSSMGAVTISLTGNPTSGPAFFTSVGAATPVLDGNLIRIGTFAVAPNAGSLFSDLASSFHEFARTTMGNATPAAANTGHPVRNNITGSTDGNSPDDDSFFLGKNVYIWVYNSVTADAAANQGIFSSTLVYLDQATSVSTSTTGYVNAFGAFNTGTPSSVAGTATVTSRFNLAAPGVPEPATLTFGGVLAALGLLRRRR